MPPLNSHEPAHGQKNCPSRLTVSAMPRTLTGTGRLVAIEPGPDFFAITRFCADTHCLSAALNYLQRRQLTLSEYLSEHLNRPLHSSS